jgi:adenine specific DNA methylase Mod
VQLISVKTSSPAGFKTVNPGPIDVTEYVLFFTKNKNQFDFKKGYVAVDYDSNYNLIITNLNDQPKDWILTSIIDSFYEENKIEDNKDAKIKWGEDWKIIRDNLIAKYALDNREKVVSKRDPHKPTDTVKKLLRKSKESDKVIEFKREGNNSAFFYKGGSLSFYSNKVKNIDGKDTSTELLTDFWFDISWAGIANEGKVKLKNGKKPERLIERINQISNNSNDYVLDFFAGSGTTNGTSIKMGRKTIGIEMGMYFHSHTLKRLIHCLNGEKSGVANNYNWKGGGIIKYQVLEQYEDVLDNLQVYVGALPENLPIKYLYKPEENSLDNTLNLFTPFGNKISYGQPTQQGFIDVAETYNYIQGYFIKSIKTYEPNKKYYKVVETTNGVLIIWRDIAINEDDSTQIIEIATKYTNIHTIEVNAEFATLSLDKTNHLKIGDKDIELKIISKEIFNQ